VEEGTDPSRPDNERLFRRWYVIGAAATGEVRVSSDGCHQTTILDCWCESEIYAEQNWSPIIIDVSKLGKPDTLAGTWKKHPPKSGLPDFALTRSFDLDGKGLKRWEWVGSKAGLLVYSSSGVPTEITGKDLFGNVTWGQNWKDGYEPLQTLDEDGNGSLEGKELELLYVWLDANTNAQADKGEVKPVSDYLTSISVRPTRDDEGNAWSEDGAALNDGTKVGSWDWWSRSYAPPMAVKRGGGKLLPSPVAYSMSEPIPATLYAWTMDGDMEPSGYFRFWKSDDKIYVIAAPKKGKGYPMSPLAQCDVSSDGSNLTWTFDESLKNEVKIQPDGSLVASGINLSTSKPYTWTAKPILDSNIKHFGLNAIANVDVKQVEKAKRYGFTYIEPSLQSYSVSGTLGELLD
jgi:hypothetical protein